MYALKDRIALSSFSDKKLSCDLKSVELDNLLSKSRDEKAMLSDSSILVKKEFS